LFDIRLAETPTEIEVTRLLFREYAAGLGVDLCFQNFEAELAGLPGAYGPPAGRLYLAWEGDRAVACAGLRPIAEGACELKRLYVRPERRGAALGRRLAERALADAEAIGYRRICLDTLPTMRAAQRLYRELGFVETTPYTYNPIPGTLFMSKDL
jgi:ribosomal protein S18 acetylase RimI-like enzyme